MDTSDSSPPNISISPSESQFLKDLLDGKVQRYRALVELSNLESTQKTSESTQPLVERLNDYPTGGVTLSNLVTYPPKLEPVPVKPLFFDAAWNYIEYPGREVEKVAENGVKENTAPANGTEQAGQQKKGWFGFGR
jgi:signal recognition particle subunit SRP68